METRKKASVQDRAINALRRFNCCPQAAMEAMGEAWAGCMNPDGEEVCQGVQCHNCWYVYLLEDGEDD